MKSREGGFQLLELMIVLALIAVGAMLGAGAWYEWLGRHRLDNAADALSAFLCEARSSAMARNAAVQVQVEEGRYAMTLRGSEAVLWRRFPQGVLAVGVPRSPVAFYSRGNAAPAGSFVLQNSSGEVRVIVSPAGRVRRGD